MKAKHWLRNLLIVTGILGVTYAQSTTCEESMIVGKKEKKHITREICVAGDVRIDDDADWQNTGKLVMGNTAKIQQLKPPKGKSIGHLVIGRSPATVILDGDLVAESLTVQSSARFDANGYDINVGFLTIGGELDMSKVNPTGRNMIVTRDIHFRGTQYNIVTDSEPLILAGTGHKMTIVTPATYSGSDVLTATGYAYKFHSLLRVDQKTRTVIDPAIYSGSILQQATGSHLEWYTPSLGRVIIE